MIHVQIINSENSIKMESISEGRIAYIRKGVGLFWNRNGEWRRFPNAILLDVLHTYDAWKLAPDKWTVKPPPSVGVLFWDQGIPLDGPSKVHDDESPGDTKAGS